MALGAQGGQALPHKLGPSVQMNHEAQQGEQKGGQGSSRLWPCPQLSPQLGSVFPRYSILPHSDPERCFSIEPEDGTIRTAVPLDREARVWHNLTVLATELGEESWAPQKAQVKQLPPGRGAVPERGGGYCHHTVTSVRPLGPQPGPSPTGRPPRRLGWAGLGWAQRVCLSIPLTLNSLHT